MGLNVVGYKLPTVERMIIVILLLIVVILVELSIHVDINVPATRESQWRRLRVTYS